MRVSRRNVLIATAGGALSFAIPRIARATTPAPDVMARLAVHAASFETMKTHASFLIAGKLEELDGSGVATTTREMTGQVTADGTKLHFAVLKYLENGQDKTADVQAKAKDADQKPASPSAPKKRDFRMPFHTGEQPRYYFDQIAVDGTTPTRVQIAFVPKIREDDTIEGSAWVDTVAGTVLSSGFKLTKPPSVMDWVHAQLTFGASTSLGPMVSKIDLEAAGGILFVRRHLRATATLTNHSIVP